MNFRRAFKEYDKSIARAQYLQRTVVDELYKKYNKDYVSALKETIEIHGVEFEMRDINEIFTRYCNNELEMAHVQLLVTLDNKFKQYIPYNKRFMDKLLDCFSRGDDDE